ncbi:MAG TPA: NifU family protein, partial [Candidatus Onthomorpha intestinigallinarum]|nr:NifU family protein [Candidatus Onthomorpha intestinigallinarum]
DMTEQERNDLETRVKASIEKIRPYLQEDGGDVQFVRMTDEKVVYVELQGHCGSCPYALMTLKNGVESAIKEDVPEIVSVERVE